MNINKFIGSIDSKLYDRIRNSKGDAECRRYLKEHLQKQLTLTSVGSSIIHVPYLKVEKDHQLIKMEELGINTTCQMFEQCINGVLYELKELKR